MPIDYQRARQDGAYLHLDAFQDRILLLGADFDGDPSTAEEGDDGVIAVYWLDPNALLTEICDILADAGVDVNAMLRCADDETVPLLPALSLVTAPFNPDPKE